MLIYIYHFTDLGPVEIQAGQSRLDATICNGQMPLQVFMFGLKTLGAIGSATNNPFLFQPTGLKTAQCNIKMIFLLYSKKIVSL